MNDPSHGRKRTASETAPTPLREAAAVAEGAAIKPGARPLAPPPSRKNEDAGGPEELTQAQIQELRATLETRRADLVASIDGRRDEERDAGREVGDEMDEANTEGATAMASKLLERDVNLLREIDRALAKMGDGSYGLCEGTGEPIGYSRLKLRPWARYSVEYQEELERAERGRGGGSSLLS